MDHLRLLCDIGELDWIFSDGATTQTFLQRIVAIVAKYMQAEVCSIYLYDDTQAELTLRATQGLSVESVDTVRLKLGEGLVGLALQERRPVCEPIASASPHFKFFPGILEEQFEAFLVVPILRGAARIGALTAQRRQEQPFGARDVLALRAVAAQLANIIENARLLMTVRRSPQRPGGAAAAPERQFLKGKVASEGFACGEAVVVDEERLVGEVLQLDVGRVYTLADFQRSLAVTENQIRNAQRWLEERFADDASLIFASHLLMLRDASFLAGMTALIKAGDSAPAAVLKTARHHLDLFLRSDNAYVREKAHDLKDLALRLLRNLPAGQDEPSLWRDRIVVTRDLFPSSLLRMVSEGVGGIVVTSGGTTAHIAILARSLQVPLVIVDAPQLLGLREGTTILLDGERGHVFVEPAPAVTARFAASRRARGILETERGSVHPVSLTRDGHRIHLLANINLLADVPIARELAAEGVGLYRTELPFLVRSTFPGEEEQVAVYRKLVEGFPGKPITIRTLDIGGDKTLAYLDGPPERNPALGLRSIRFCLEHPEVFTPQLRAILRASLESELRIMFPMIGSLEEFRAARQAVQRCLAALAAEGLPHHANPKIGMMVEVPAVVELIDAFAREAEFFAIGTNDLVQYTLATDRANERVAHSYVPHHPSVLRAIKRIVAGAAVHGRAVCVCGEMAHETRYLPFFLGIGVRTFSMDPLYLGPVQRAMAGMTVGEAEALARAVLAETTASRIAEILDAGAERLCGARESESA